MRKYIIVNADDFGLSPSVNRGIIEVYRAGVVTSTSLMANLPGFYDAVQLAKAEQDLAVGFHFNLTYGKPLSPPSTVPSLVNRSGNFNEKQGKWTKEDITTELKAQWNRVVKAGIHPTHVDSHQHIHASSRKIYLALERLALVKKLPLRRRYPNRPVAQACCRTNRLIGNEYFRSGGLRRLFDDLRSVNPGVTEIICHPGYVDKYVREISPWTDVRLKELQVLLDPRVAERFKRLHLYPINYKKLKQLGVRQTS